MLLCFWEQSQPTKDDLCRPMSVCLLLSPTVWLSLLTQDFITSIPLAACSPGPCGVPNLYCAGVVWAKYSAWKEGGCSHATFRSSSPLNGHGSWACMVWEPPDICLISALIQVMPITAAGSSGHGKQAAIRCFRVSLMNSWGKCITLSVAGSGRECEHSCRDSLVSVNPPVLHKTVSGGVPLTRGGRGTVGHTDVYMQSVNSLICAVNRTMSQCGRRCGDSEPAVTAWGASWWLPQPVVKTLGLLWAWAPCGKCQEH